MNEIESFLEYSKIHLSVDYGDPLSVKAGNNAADSMMDIAKKLVEMERTEELLELLNHKDAGPWVAFNILELPKVSDKQRNRCLKYIKGIAGGSDVNAMGADLWLKERGYDHS